MQSLSATSVEQSGRQQAPLSASATHREPLGPVLLLLAKWLLRVRDAAWLVLYLALTRQELDCSVTKVLIPISSGMD